MDSLQVFLGNVFYLSEGVAAFASVLFLNKLKNSYWKYFLIFLIFIFAAETYGTLVDFFNNKPSVQSDKKLSEYAKELVSFKKYFYNYLVIPVQFVFFYWLYAAKSLGKPNMFYLFTGIYLFSFIPHELFFNNAKIIFSFNYTVGSLFLLYLIILEYFKQVNSDDILNFGNNRMFYINWGVTVFYIGTLPLFSFWSVFVKYRDLFDVYYIYFQISGIVMYILCTISVILGKNTFRAWEKQSS